MAACACLLAMMLPCRRGHAAACLLLIVTLLQVILSSAHPAAARCGVEDDHGVPVSPDDDGGAVGRFTLLKTKPRWTRRLHPIVITYAASPTATVSYLLPDDVRAAFRRAFERWALVIPVSFVETDDYHAADIKLGFYNNVPRGELGNASPWNGRIHLNASVYWALLEFTHHGKETSSSVAFDLESVMTHEIGHILGLGHSTLPKAVMYHTIMKWQKKAELTVDDVQGVQLLYGSKPGFRLCSIHDTSMSPERSGWVTSSASLLVAGAVSLVIHYL